MNKICETCDTRKRLKMCNGRDGNFNYCYRKAGSTAGLEETITPFNSVSEIFDNQCDYIRAIDSDSVVLDETRYADHMCLIYGRFIGDEAAKFTDKRYPVGYIIC